MNKSIRQIGQRASKPQSAGNVLSIELLIMHITGNHNTLCKLYCGNKEVIQVGEKAINPQTTKL